MHYIPNKGMKFSRTIALSLGLVMATGCAMAMKDKKMAMKKNMAHVHIGHVMTGWKDTPGKKGLLTTAIAEAKIAVKHAGFSAKSKGASKGVKAHAVHVSASSGNAVTWAKEIVALCKKVTASNSVTEVASLVAKIKGLTGQLLTGIDAKGDGKISWKKGEGGLNTANKHMGFMMKGEGLKS